MKKGFITAVCVLLVSSFLMTACAEKEAPAQAVPSIVQKDTPGSGEETSNEIPSTVQKDTPGSEGEPLDEQGTIIITNPEICYHICDELRIEQTDRFTEEQLSNIHTVDFSLLRDEDVEWLPRINFSDSNLDFRNNVNITDLRILEGFQSLKEQDFVECLWIGSWQEGYEALTSLEGLEYLFGGDGTVLNELRIDKYAAMDISALKDIGLCRQIIVNLMLSELLTGWEQLSDIYENNARIGTILINVFETNELGTIQILNYKLDSHSADVDKRIQEYSSDF